jgi:LETM1-like protein
MIDLAIAKNGFSVNRTLEQLAKEQTQKASKKKQELAEAGIVDDESSHTITKQEDSAGSMLEFLSKARRGEMIPPDVIIRYAKYFQDDLTLGNMPRMQLINMCRYMSIPPYVSRGFSSLCIGFLSCCLSNK